MRGLLLAPLMLATPLAAQQAMDHSAMMGAAIPPAGMVAGMDMQTNIMTEPGQAAFATIEEIVNALVADPSTDWMMVDIDGLREHLVDMDTVFTQASVLETSIENGLIFQISGQGRSVSAIQNMIPAHAEIMDGFDGWVYVASLTDTGATLTITVPDDDIAKLSGLGLFGVLAQGGHHQAHHWMMASGANPHG